MSAVRPGRCRLAVLAVIAAAMLSCPVPGARLGVEVAAAATPATLILVGRQTLADRGMNAALAVAGHCAWVGSRNDAPVQVVDIATPSAPAVLGALTAHPGSTPRELRAVASAHLLVVLYYRLSGSGPNRLEIFHWGSDCAHATIVGRYDFGAAAPHEFYLWQDPANAGRVLLYTTMFATAGHELQVIDISDPAHPVLAGGWAPPATYGRAPAHSVALSADGNTAYLSLWTGGLVVADVSDFTAGRPSPAVRPLTPPGAVFKTSPGNVHSAVPLADGIHVLTTDERYPAPYGAGCPFGSAHVVDVSNPRQPAAVATLSVSENDPAACNAAPRGTWTSHNPTLTAHLAFVSWYSAGVEVFALEDPTRPVRLAELRPAGASPAQRDLQLGITDAMSWSYPVIYAGLVYVVDVNQGLLVLSYQGPHQQEVTGTRFAEGNSNLNSATAAVAVSGLPSVLPTRSAAGLGSPPPRPHGGIGGAGLAALAGAALVLAVGASAWAWRRRRPA